MIRRLGTILAFFSLFFPGPATASGDASVTGVTDAGTHSTATVLTYYGLRKLEFDEKVSDEDKIREWQAFIERSKEHVEYAKQAIDRWKNAARVRVVESAQRDDENAQLSAVQKVRSWQHLLELYPKAAEAQVARKRIAHWSKAETMRLVEAAEIVERAKASKLDRIRAWKAVLAWAKKGPEAKAAKLRITALEDQLFSEATSLDKISRVDTHMKLDVWRDVLACDPTPAHRKIAEKRVQELEAAIKK